MNKKEKICQGAVSVLLIGSVVLCITVIAQILSVGYVTIFGNSLFRVVTGSMEPTIPTGALLICKEAEIEDVEVGDIICFRSKESNMLGQVITHRVTEIIENEDGEIYLETSGDANPSADGYYVTESNFIGKVRFYTKDGNFIAKLYGLITSKVGFLSCIVFPVLLISGAIMRDSVKSIQKEMRELERAHVQNQESVSEQEDYEAMVERLKKEILEEVRQSVTESGEQK